MHPAWTEIDLDALAANYRLLEGRIGAGVRVIASVKADAYGMGAVAAARAFQDLGVFALATGTVDEAVAIRGAGVTLPIVLFNTYLPGDAARLLEHDFIPTIDSMAMAEAVSRAAPRPRPVYVKVDAGLGRLGVAMIEAPGFIERIAAMANLDLQGVYTHLAFAHAGGRDWAAARLGAFDALLAELKAMGIQIPVTQARASSCLLAGLGDSCSAVCVGHAYYGLSPYSEADVGEVAGLRPVVRALRTRLVRVARHRQGSDVAIGGLYGLRAGMRTGVGAIGLSGGLSRPAPGQDAHVLVRGRRVPVIAVSLEHLSLDLGGVDEAQVGDQVTVFGTDGSGEISLDEVAAWQGRSPLEVLSMLAGRTARRTLDGGGAFDHSSEAPAGDQA